MSYLFFVIDESRNKKIFLVKKLDLDHFTHKS